MTGLTKVEGSEVEGRETENHPLEASCLARPPWMSGLVSKESERKEEEDDVGRLEV